ncbi:MAG: cupin domain-containing protein [Methylocella sp.]
MLTNDKGKKWILKKGDAFIIPPGFKGTWETVEKVRKHYVILMPKG